MMLRDHSLMTRKTGFSTWPPKWTTTRTHANDMPAGEVGTLQQPLMNGLMGTKIFLFIDYNGSRYMGMLSFDDQIFCSKIFALLKANIGRSIKDIGDLDLSRML
jgi:hypothetical protein